MISNHVYGLFILYTVVLGTTDVLQALGLPKFPHGVSTDLNRTSAYIVNSEANLYIPLSDLYRGKFPKDFSILITAKLNTSSDGYLLTFSDIMGQQKMAIKYGEGLTLEYYDQNGLPGPKSPGFRESLSDSTWHQFAFSVEDQLVTLFVDCEKVKSQFFGRAKDPYVGVNLMLALGPYFARYGSPFEVRICYIQEPFASLSYGKRLVSIVKHLRQKWNNK